MLNVSFLNLFNQGSQTGTPIATQTVSSFGYDGETYTLNAPHEVGYFYDGSPFIVSNNAGQITATTTPAADTNGDGFVGNGMVKNPANTENNNNQGFDAYFGDYPPKTSYNNAYVASANVDPAASNSATWAAGEEATFVKCFRQPAMTGRSDAFQVCSKYHYITILSSVPTVGTVTPGSAHTTKRRLNVNDVTFTPRGFTIPASWPSVADILASVPENLGLFAGGEARRRNRLDTLIGTTNDGYSAEIADWYAMYVSLLNSNALTPSQRDEVITRILVHASQVLSWMDAGENPRSGAGQGAGIWLWVAAAAALTGDQSIMDTLRLNPNQPDDSFWVSEANIGVPASGKSGIAAQTYLEEQIGMPHIQPDETGSHHRARYFNIASYLIGWEILSLLLFNQGSGTHSNGAEQYLDGGVVGTSNSLSAGLGMIDRRRSWTDNITGSYPVTNTWTDLYDIVASFNEYTPWTGQPDQPPLGGASEWKDPYFSAGGNGEIVLNTQGIGFNTEPITRTDVRYSIDNVQYVELSDITFSGNQYTIGGLLRGVQHWCSWRRWSATGTSPWSANHPELQSSSDERGIVAPTGTSSASALSNVVQPRICFLKYPGWNYDIWEEAPSTLDANDINLSAGVGYWSGYPAPQPSDFTYQWLRDGEIIPGATSKEYTRVAADADSILNCDVTVGGVTVRTPDVNVPPITVYTAGVIIDTDFRGRWAVDHEQELLTATSFNANVVHQPTAVPVDLGESFGGIMMDKTGASPNMELTLQNALQPNTTYNVIGEYCIAGGDRSDRATFYFYLRDNDDVNQFSSPVPGDLVSDASGQVWRQPFSGQFTTSATGTIMRYRAQWNHNTGGAGNADIWVTRLYIYEA